MKDDITPNELKALLSEKGMKQREVADILSLTQPMVSKIFNGLRSISPAEQKLLRLYFYGEIPFDMIRPEDKGYSSEFKFTEEEWHVMGIMATRCGFGDAGEWIVSRIRAELAFMEHKETLAKQILEPEHVTPLTAEETSKNVIAFSIPLTSVAAGAPVSSQIDDTYQTSKEHKEGYFAAQAFGESMHPVIPNGSISLIMGRKLWKNPHLKKGQIYTFSVNGEQTIKRYNTRPATPNEIKRGESYIYASTTTGKPSVKVLESINPDFPEIIIENGDIEPTGWFESLLK